MANNTTVIGRLAADSEQKFTPSGAAVLEFRVADDVGFGEKKTTNWWRCAVWGKQAEGKLIDFLKKGQQVVIFGEITMREWEDKEGAKKLSPEIRVNSVNLVGAKREGDNSGGDQYGGSAPASRQEPPAPAKKAPSFDDDDSDIPF